MSDKDDRDVLTRLRDPDRPWNLTGMQPNVMVDAADEIERLRAELAERDAAKEEK